MLSTGSRMSADKKGKTMKYKAVISETIRLFDISKKFWTLDIVQVDASAYEPVFSRSYTNKKNAEKAAKRELAKWNGA